MALVIPFERSTQVMAGVALLLLAGWLFYLKPGNRTHQAFALFLTLRGFLFLFLGVQTTDGILADALLMARLTTYVLVVLPFAAFFFGHRFRNRFGPSRGPGVPVSPRALPWALLAGALALLALYVSNRGLFVGGGNVWALLLPFEMLSYLGIAAILLHDAYNSSVATDRRALQLVSMGLTFEAAYHASHRAILFHPFPSNPDIYRDPVVATAWILWLVVIAGVLGMVASRFIRARRASDLDQLRGARRYAAFLILPLATGALPAAFAPALVPLGTNSLHVYVFLGGLWGLVFAAFLSFAILNHQLFGIELKVKFALRQSTVAGAFIAMFFITSELAQQVLEVGTGSTWIGILAAGFLVFFMAPLQRLADRVSDTALPGVQNTAAYREGRKDDLYRALFASSVREGPLTEEDRQMLAGLQERFQIPPLEAKMMEIEVLHSLGQTGEPHRPGAHEVPMHA